MKGFCTLTGGVVAVALLGTASLRAQEIGSPPTSSSRGGPAITLGRPVPIGQPLTPASFQPVTPPVQQTSQVLRPVVRGQIPEEPFPGTVPPPPPPGSWDAPGAGCDVAGPDCVPALEQPAEQPQCRPIHCYFFADFLWLKPRGADVPFAQPRDGIAPMTGVPKGPVAVADFDYSIGLRGGAGYGFTDRSFVQGSYTWYEASSTSSVTAPAGTVLHPLITFPNTIVALADSLSAKSSYDIDFQLIDAEFKHMFCRGDNYYVAFLVGARYAHLDQEFRADYSILGTTTVTSNIEFDGIGPRIGLEGECHSKCGLFVFGRGFANFLVGQFKGTYEQTNTFAGLQASTSFEDNRVVPNFDLELGVGWQTRNGRLRIMAGYYLNCWFNTLTTTSFIQGVQNSNFTTNGDNLRDRLIFDGLMARLEVRF